MRLYVSIYLICQHKKSNSQAGNSNYYIIKTHGLYVNKYFVYEEKKSEEQLTDQTNSKTLKIKTTIVK